MDEDGVVGSFSDLSAEADLVVMDDIGARGIRADKFKA